MMLHVHRPDDAFKMPPWKPKQRAFPSSPPPPMREKSDKPCDFGPTYTHFAKGRCSFYHEPGSLKQQSLESKSKIPCRHGPKCLHLQAEECVFFHEPGPPPERMRKMTAGLSDPMTLPAFTGKVNPFEGVGIQKVEMLASFSVLEDERLAVPGMSLFPFTFPYSPGDAELNRHKDSPLYSAF